MISLTLTVPVLTIVCISVTSCRPHLQHFVVAHRLHLCRFLIARHLCLRVKLQFPSRFRQTPRYMPLGESTASYSPVESPSPPTAAVSPAAQ
ncbi:hypothetical protein TIFTF001_036108 [Ficus carica]|uniref:Secreted protein n=1 Tax=Ficus carica TaxID=3494 RepID=A0AA88JAV4_FICCA|nr:hypothetical protein TIFTF001_036108 [Ficus carica]